MWSNPFPKKKEKKKEEAEEEEDDEVTSYLYFGYLISTMKQIDNIGHTWHFVHFNLSY